MEDLALREDEESQEQLIDECLDWAFYKPIHKKVEKYERIFSVLSQFLNLGNEKVTVEEKSVDLKETPKNCDWICFNTFILRLTGF